MREDPIETHPHFPQFRNLFHMSTNPTAKIAEVAERFIGTLEITPNRAPAIEKFWEKNDYTSGEIDRQPWCCAFTVFCVQVADDETEEFNLKHPPKMAACSAFMEWAKDPANGCLVFHPGDTKYFPQRGDVVCYLPKLSHIGIIQQDYAHDGFIRTVEGNTNGEGAREGDGVYSKQRRYDFAGSFIRMPATAITA